VSVLDTSVVPDRIKGVEVLSRDEYAARDPNWKRTYYELHVQLMRDVPQPSGTADQTFEDFITFIDGPLGADERVFFAIVGGRPVGVTELFLSEAKPGHAATGLTGVSREHRRKGLARAMKLHAAHWAREQGITEIWADNEADNPMLKLNEQIGFRRHHELVIFER
jgi:GNAT superfamily N-acetyltransferase